VQLAGNGHWEFWHAFRTNEIDYAQFYRTEPLAQAYELVRAEFDHIGPTRFTGSQRLPIERDVKGHGPEKRLNVVLVSVESLSADFLGVFGNRDKLTPNLDRLAAEGMLFTQIYATGTRTVRGLEALTLSIPPTPGHSIVKRPDNDHLYTLGEIFAEKGYEPLYLYGGYGYFDNMNAFFGGNGYTVIDRSAIAKEAIHYENVWGVADEDLFTLALDQLDRRHEAGTPFFAHIMTTSNHRPFTYPENRVDVPSGTGREGAVKYTDWAIGDFIRRARAKPWFDDTVFVLVADHTAAGRGKTDLPIENFHIPLIIYGPKHVAPARIATLASQIDVAPTLLALLNFSYRSRFFGQDIISEGPKHQRAFLANYQTVGYLEEGILAELRPQRRWRLVDAATGRERPLDDKGREMLDEAVGHYEAAAEAYRSGALRRP
jgi:phosphoglycerol transferase MdoB-like AlkP superfamily enzyme